jgi:hypothetical protein
MQDKHGDEISRLWRSGSKSTVQILEEACRQTPHPRINMEDVGLMQAVQCIANSVASASIHTPREPALHT